MSHNIGKSATLAGVSLIVMTQVLTFEKVLAQAALPVPSGTVSDAEVVIVTARAPIMGSQRAALAVQRNADNLVSVIAADTVGQFPDQNSAAALARVPSVAVQRDQGQERYLQIRGAPNRWTSVSIDGINIVGADEAGNQRAFRFDAVPSVILSQLEVNKSLTSDLSAEAIVARVNLRTFSAFDRKGFAASADIGAGKMVLGEGGQEQAALRVSWSGERFGFIAAASHYEREQITDNRETTYNLVEGRPINLDFRVYNLVRASNGGILGAEFRPAEGHKLFWKSIYTEFTDNEERNQYVFQGAGTGTTGTRTAASGDLVGVGVRGTFNDGYYANSNLIHTIGGDHFVAGWDLQWRFNRTETENTTDLPIVLSQQAAFTQRPSVRYDRSDPTFPTLSLARTIAGPTAGTFARGAEIPGLDNSMFTLNLLLPLVSSMNADADILKFDAKRDFSFNNKPVEMMFGLQLDEREVTGSLLSASTPPLVLTALLPRVGLAFDFAKYNTGRPWTTKFPAGTFLPFVNNKLMRQDLDAGLAALQTAGLYNPANNISPTDRFAIDERLLAGYGRGKWEIGDVTIVAGVRFEQFEQEIAGFLRSGTTVTPLTVNNDQTDWFPSLNVKYDFGEDWVIRGALQRGVARASFGTVRAGANISDIGRTISGGNPNLESEYTWGFDASLERYLDKSGIISASTFIRNVSNVLYSATSEVNDDTYDVPGLDRTGYILTSELNGDTGQLYGIEFNWQQQFAFLPAPFDGFGFQGNLTLLDGEFRTRTGRKEKFPGTSPTIANASLFYEKDKISARISYQWRDTWIDTLNSLGSGEFRKGYENVDFSARYALTEKVSFYLDWNNITDEVYIAFEGDERFPSEVEQIGTRWLAGVRLNF